MKSALAGYAAVSLSFAAVCFQADCTPKASPFTYLSVGVFWPMLGVLATYHTLAGEQIPRWGEGCRD